MNQPFGFCGFPMRRYTDLILMRLMSVFGGKFVCPNWSTASNRKICLTYLVDLCVYLGLIFILSTSSCVSLCVFCSVRFFVPLWKGFGRVLTTKWYAIVSLASPNYFVGKFADIIAYDDADNANDDDDDHGNDNQHADDNNNDHILANFCVIL